MAQDKAQTTAQLPQSLVVPEAILESMDDAFYALDRQWCFTYLNGAAERLFHHPRGELLGKSIWDSVPEDIGPPFREQFHRALEQNVPVHFEVPALPSKRPLEVWAYPSATSLGVHVQDISKRRGASQRLLELEELSRKVFLDGPLGLALVGPDEHYVKANPAYCRMVGYTDDELRTLTWRDSTPPDDWKGTQDAITRLIDGQELVYRTEKRYLRKDRQIRWGELTISLIHMGEDRKPYCLMAMVQDITERKRLDEERGHLLRSEQAARADAEAANRHKDQFMAVLSHELRTPLTPLLARLELLRRQPRLPPEVRSHLDMIQHDVELEARLIDDLLDITQIARGTLQLAFGKVDVHGVVRHALELCQPAIAAKKLDVTLDLQAGDPCTRADPVRLQQVFWNLISNATRYTVEGGRIVIRSSNTPSGEIRLEVIDTGIGIEPSVMARLFNAFEQGEQSMTRRFGGLGLGLAICRALVDLHGGKIAAVSEGKDKGSTFTVELPLFGRRTGAEAVPPASPPRAGRRLLRILVVEDNEDTLRLLTRLLSLMGHQVRNAKSVREALEIVSTGDLDLVISDIGLPDGSGWELMRQLKAIRPMKGIALSGFGMEDDIRRSKDAGFAVHLTKPINVKCLEQVIQQVSDAAPGAVTS